MISAVYEEKDLTFHYTESSLRDIDFRKVINAAFVHYTELSEIEALFNENKWYDILMVDIDDNPIKAVKMLRALRKNRNFTGILVLASADPMNRQMCPRVSADEFVLKYFLNNEVYEIFYNILCRIRKDSYILKSKNVTKRIFYKDILYFKRLSSQCFVHTACGDYSIYKTMSQILNEIMYPIFIKCHPDYLVNKLRILRETDDLCILDSSDRISKHIIKRK